MVVIWLVMKHLVKKRIWTNRPYSLEIKREPLKARSFKGYKYENSYTYLFMILFTTL
jgi:hypothetical protein